VGGGGGGAKKREEDMPNTPQNMSTGGRPDNQVLFPFFSRLGPSLPLRLQPLLELALAPHSVGITWGGQNVEAATAKCVELLQFSPAAARIFFASSDRRSASAAACSDRRALAPWMESLTSAILVLKPSNAAFLFSLVCCLYCITASASEAITPVFERSRSTARARPRIAASTLGGGGGGGGGRHGSELLHGT
jgi:hypothetical protein